VLDEPSIGLHPSNIDALMQVARRLIATGNSVVLVDHDVRVLRHADWLIEIGPGAGSRGGQVVATGKVTELEASSESLIGGFLSGREPPSSGPDCPTTTSSSTAASTSRPARASPSSPWRSISRSGG
jgi:excinuclease UvrABC ATPase subunit